jgi:hypothetical protein
VQQFVNGLTGEGGLTEGLTDSEKQAYIWGERVKSVMKAVINFKEELILVAGVIATVFTVSKIAAGVTATIALINTLIRAYNLLKSSAIVAGIASAFALNPLLGVGAAALAASVLSAANYYANQGNTPEAGSAPSTGAIPFATGFAAPAATTKGGGTTGGTTTGGGSFTGSGGGVTTASKAAASAATAAANVVTNSFGSGSFRQAEAATSGGGGTTINLTVTGAFEPEGTARTIVNTLNNSLYRGGGGGANSLVM